MGLLSLNWQDEAIGIIQRTCVPLYEKSFNDMSHASTYQQAHNAKGDPSLRSERFLRFCSLKRPAPAKRTLRRRADGLMVESRLGLYLGYQSRFE